jgi:hypothetical protein
MSDLLTCTVNVPAERAKLRRLRDEIAADVAAREAYAKRYTRRGYPRLPDVPALAAEEVRRDGEVPALPVRVETGVAIPSTAADVREAPAGCRGCIRCACGVGQEGWDD